VQAAKVAGVLRTGPTNDNLAGASARAEQSAVAGAASDLAFVSSVWMPATPPLAARDRAHFERHAKPGILTVRLLTLIQRTSGLARALDDRARHSNDRTDLAGMAPTESLTAALAPQLPTPFTPEPA
jgi:hypothetical protein